MKLSRCPLRARLLMAFFALLAFLVVPTISVLAAGSVYGSGDYGECEYGLEGSDCSISIANNGFILNLFVQPTISGSCTIQNDQVTVTTYDPNGYTLTLGGEDTTTDLENGSNSLPASAGTPASPLALSDTWGYRVDGLSAFGAGPTSAETNAALDNSIKFAGAQASNLTADTIASSSTFSASTGASTTIWYGICIDTGINIPTGIYSATVLYTAVAN